MLEEHTKAPNLPRTSYVRGVVLMTRMTGWQGLDQEEWLISERKRMQDDGRFATVHTDGAGLLALYTDVNVE